MLKVAKVVALNSDTYSIQPLVSLNEAEYDLFVLVSAQIEDAFTKTRYALSETESAFFASDEPISARLPQIIQVIKSALAGADSVQVLAVAIQRSEVSDRALYLISQGNELKAMVFRGDSLINLTEVGDEGQLISGFFRDSDRLILISQTLIDLLGSITEIVRSSTQANFEDEILSRLPRDQALPVSVVVIEEDRGESMKDLPRTPADRGSLLAGIFRILSKLHQIVPRSKRGLMLVGTALFLLALAGTAMVYWQQQILRKEGEYNAKFQSANTELERARSLKDLDVVGAAQSLTEAERLIASALSIKPNDQDALNLRSQIESEKGGILKTYEVQNFNLWLNLDLIRKGFIADHLSASVGYLLVLDRNSKSLVRITQNSKSPQVLSGEEKLGEARSASLNGEMAFIHSEDKGVLRVDAVGNVVTPVTEIDLEWGSIVALYGFAGNVYLLDSTSSQVWKYLPIERGYSDKRAYLRSDTKTDLTNALKMQIDGSVWILKNSGEILKFTQGAQDNFSFTGLGTPVSSARSFFVSDKTEYLYVLESDRLLVLSKSGAYRSQYRSEQFKEIVDLVVDEESKKVYLLEGKNIYLLELQ